MRINSTTGNTVYASSRAYLAAGFSVIPLKLDGSKHPAISWKQYQERHATSAELSDWFDRPNPYGIGVICGAVSGNLEVLDFDDPYVCAHYFAKLSELGLEDLARSCWRVMTPTLGTHLYYRHQGEATGNQKLAMSADGKETLIETRGEGGYVVAPGSPIGVHSAGERYIPLGAMRVPLLTADERQSLLAYAKSFDKRPAPPPAVLQPQRLVNTNTTATAGEAPGAVFNRVATWAQVLTPHGWQLARELHGGRQLWRRPAARTSNWDATTNRDGTDRLWVFSTSTVFDTGRYYDKFAAYTVLNFGGNFADAARQLARDGFGQMTRRQAA